MSFSTYENIVVKAVFLFDVLIKFTYFERINSISRIFYFKTLKSDLFTFLTRFSGTNESSKIWNSSYHFSFVFPGPTSGFKRRPSLEKITDLNRIWFRNI